MNIYIYELMKILQRNKIVLKIREITIRVDLCHIFVLFIFGNKIKNILQLT